MGERIVVKMTKAEALAEYLGEKVVREGGENVFKTTGTAVSPHGSVHYHVLTKEEADVEAEGCILEGVWALERGFLSAHLLIPKPGAEIVTAALQKLYEGGNDALLQLVKDKGELVKQVLKANGRGRLLSGYDGVEIEYGGYFIYRVYG